MKTVILFTFQTLTTNFSALWICFQYYECAAKQAGTLSVKAWWNAKRNEVLTGSVTNSCPKRFGHDVTYKQEENSWVYVCIAVAILELKKWGTTAGPRKE